MASHLWAGVEAEAIADGGIEMDEDTGGYRAIAHDDELRAGSIATW
ncbi:MAG TPA: hypothetical protein VMK12_22360 [Anaeromyxobacteraceae bacterium]|nr:hypothetical protein [Anaeromyxobacteraceae bacterium]